MAVKGETRRGELRTSETAAADIEDHPVKSAMQLLTMLEWLASDECHSLDDADLVSSLGRRLRQLGIAVDRLTVHLTTLHPDVAGRSIAWAPGEPVEIHDRNRSSRLRFKGSMLSVVMETREPMILGVSPLEAAMWQSIDIFEGRKLRQIMAAPLCNVDGPLSVVGFATKQKEGFSISDMNILNRILPALRNACELRVLKQVELTLLDTYIGPMTAKRVLAGRVRQGDVETIDAALLLCDLRGFTELSNSLSAARVLEVLNAYFETVIPAISLNGGEILKFMGDAVLAFFPGFSAAGSCSAALLSARTIRAEMDAKTFSGVDLTAGIALHYGGVSYGNIGAGRRMDFTVIGPDVNLVSRIQQACSDLKHPTLMSATFNRASSANATSIGYMSYEDSGSRSSYSRSEAYRESAELCSKCH